MGGGASAKADDDEDVIDPHLFVPYNQTIVHSGVAWKLNTGENAKSKQSWLKRKMWLTSGGGLYYYSRQHEKPMGRSIRGLNVVVVDGKRLGRYVFELHPIPFSRRRGSQAPDVLPEVPTTIAFDKLHQRDAWVMHLEQLANQQSMGLEEKVLRKSEKARNRLKRQQSMLSVTPDYGSERRTSFHSNSAEWSSRVSQTYVDGVLGAVVEVEEKPKRQSILGFGLRRVSRYSVTKKISNGPSVFGSEVDDDDEDDAASSQSSNISEIAVAKLDSQVDFALKSNAFIAIDFDDTLFPTFWIRDDLQLHWKIPLRDQVDPSPERDQVEALLSSYGEAVERFLRLATEIAHVSIVTLACRPWVDIACENFMPGLGELIKELDIKVVYAREMISQKIEREYNAAEFRSSDDEIDFWMMAKAKAMQEELELMHKDKSWKNIMSLGDSDIERRAMLYTSREHVAMIGACGEIKSQGLTSEVVLRDGNVERLRTKTLKMINDPSLEELLAQITIMTSWLPHMVQKETGFDIKLEGSDDDKMLNDINMDFTGRDDSLTWVRLAGLE